MKIINKTRIDTISFDDGSYAQIQRPTIMSAHGKELYVDFLKLMLKKVTFQYEEQLEQEELESLLLKQE